MVQIDAISPEDAMRVVNGVGGAIKGRDRNTDTPLRVDTVYDEVRARLKVIITGSLADHHASAAAGRPAHAVAPRLVMR